MDLVCFSHLRWSFVYQRPQHLLSRFTNYYRVFYVEEVVYNDEEDGFYLQQNDEQVWIVIPHLKHASQTPEEVNRKLTNIVSGLFSTEKISNYILWYYSPMSLLFTRNLSPQLVVYDCMDELSAFKFAPEILKDLERELFSKADVVFTGGHSLYEAKKLSHHNIFCFPSSIDKAHFNKARFNKAKPEDQDFIPHPRLGFFGVLDERFDIDLIKDAAIAKPEWHFILIGPVVKIDPASLPRLNNIHYLGIKPYSALPDYISGWDIALIPFALNESTRFISPTKTPEYLAAGVPVISTAIQDVIKPYGENKLVHIVKTSGDLVDAASAELAVTDRSSWLKKVDVFLADISWNNTWHDMNAIINKQLSKVKSSVTTKKEMYV